MVIFLQLIILFLFMFILFGFSKRLYLSSEVLSLIFSIGIILQAVLSVTVVAGDSSKLVMKAAVNAGVGIYKVNNEGEVIFYFIKPDGSEVYWMEELIETRTR